MSDDDREPTYVRDPMFYVGRVRRDEAGRIRTIEVIYDDDGMVKIENGDEFISFKTTVLLENDPRKP